jgi:WXG100 family type VII secretion target
MKGLLIRKHTYWYIHIKRLAQIFILDLSKQACRVRYHIFLELTQRVSTKMKFKLIEGVLPLMATIHVNTNLMRQLGQIFVQLDEQIANQIRPDIQHHIGRLEGDWQGVSRQRFEQMFQEWRSAVDNVVQYGEDIGRHLQDTAQRFETADKS